LIIKSSCIAMSVLVLFTPPVVSSATGADASGMFRGDPAHTGFYAEHGVKSLTLKWRVETGGKVRSTPLVAGNLVLVGSEDGTLYAVDRESGSVRWTHDCGGPVTSSPAAADGRVFVVGGEGNLVALRLDTGKLLWTFTIGDPLPYEQRPGDPRTWDFYLSSPVVHDGTVLFGGADGNVYSVDAESGMIRWKHDLGGAIRSTPAVAGDAVYVGSMDGTLHSLELATGEQRWVFDTEGNPYFPRGEVQSSPAVADGVVYVGARDGFLYAVDAGSGAQRWRADHEGSWVITSPAVHDGLVFAGSSDGEFVHAVDAKTGEERWRFETGSRVFSSPAVAGGLVYFGTWNGDLIGLDVGDGSRKASNMAESAIMSSPVLADGVLYVGSDDSCLYAFEGKAYDPAAEPRAVRLEPEILEQLTGTYREEDGSTYAVTVEDDHLVIDTGMQTLAIYPSSPTEFFMKEYELRVRFVRDEGGAVSGLEFVSGETVTPAARVP
jgi:outer membrane protein assembly factor BamB